MKHSDLAITIRRAGGLSAACGAPSGLTGMCKLLGAVGPMSAESHDGIYGTTRRAAAVASVPYLRVLPEEAQTIYYWVHGGGSVQYSVLSNTHWNVT